MTEPETYVNPWGRTVPLPEPGPLTASTAPPEGAKVLLKVQCGACHSLMSVVLEDAEGGLWISGTDRLREWQPAEGDAATGTPGRYWNLEETEPTDMGRWNYSGCRRAKSPDCGVAYSWSLSEHRPALAKARATRKVETIRL